MKTQRFQTSIAVGATGMLSVALDWIARNSEQTVVVARRASKELIRGHRLGQIALDVDWRDPETFEKTIMNSVDLERVDLLLLWIHGTGRAGLDRLLDRFVSRKCLIVHVLSSAAGDPAAYRDAIGRRATGSRRCTYVTVKLGAKRSGLSSRWLTHDEISAGAIEAMDTRRDVVVGTKP